MNDEQIAELVRISEERKNEAITIVAGLGGVQGVIDAIYGMGGIIDDGNYAKLSKEIEAAQDWIRKEAY